MDLKERAAEVAEHIEDLRAAAQNLKFLEGLPGVVSVSQGRVHLEANVFKAVFDRYDEREVSNKWAKMVELSVSDGGMKFYAYDIKRRSENE